MELLHQILWQALLNLAALVCFLTAFTWFLQTYRMYKSGEARPLLLPSPISMGIHILAGMWRKMQQRFSPELRYRSEKMQFEWTITGNYLKAVMAFVCGLLAAFCAFMLGH